MSALTTSKSNAPNTLIDLDQVPSKEVCSFISREFTTAVLQVFTGGQVIDQHDLTFLQAIYDQALVGFPPEAYAEACKIMIMQRTDRWRPTPAECREWLEKAPSTRALRKVQSEQQGLLVEARGHFQKSGFHSTHWNRSQLGPLPGEPGCQLSHENQYELFREMLEAAKRHVLRRRRPANYRRLSEADAVGYQIRGCLLADTHLDFTPGKCPIPDILLIEFNIPTSQEALDAAEAEFNEFYKEEKARDDAKFEALRARNTTPPSTN